MASRSDNKILHNRKNPKENTLLRNVEIAERGRGKHSQRRSRRGKTSEENLRSALRKSRKGGIEYNATQRPDKLKEVVRERLGRQNDTHRSEIRIKMDGFETSSDDASLDKSIDLLHEVSQRSSTPAIEKQAIRSSDLKVGKSNARQRYLVRPLHEKRQREVGHRAIAENTLYEDYDDYAYYEDVVRNLLSSSKNVVRSKRRPEKDYSTRAFLDEQNSFMKDLRRNEMPFPRKHHSKNGNSRKDLIVNDAWPGNSSTDDSEYDEDFCSRNKTVDSRWNATKGYATRPKPWKLQTSLSLDHTVPRLHPSDIQSIEQYGNVSRSILSPKLMRSRDSRNRHQMEEEIIEKLMQQREKELILMGTKNNYALKRLLRSDLQNQAKQLRQLHTRRAAPNLERFEFMEEDASSDQSNENGSNPDFAWNAENCDDPGMLDTPSLSPGYEDFCDILYDNDNERDAHADQNQKKKGRK